MSGIKTTFHAGKDLTTARNPENLQDGSLFDSLTASQPAVFKMDLTEKQCRPFVCRVTFVRLSEALDCEMIGKATGRPFR
jgi:hypothetical protein